MAWLSMPGRRSVLIVTFALLIALAGCGGDDTSPDPDETMGTDGNLFDMNDEPKAEAAGQQSGDQVTNRLEVASTTGSVTDGEITSVDMTIKQAPGAANVDMRNVTVSWVESGGTYNLVHETVPGTATDADGRFAISAFVDPDGSSPVVNDPDDRLTMVFDLGSQTRGSVFDTTGTNVADPGDLVFSDNLEEGEIVTIKLMTQSGASTNVRLVVPQSLEGTDAVNL